MKLNKLLSFIGCLSISIFLEAPCFASTFKTIHIMNPFDKASQVLVKHRRKALSVQGETTTTQPSDQFSDVSGVGRKDGTVDVLFFTGMLNKGGKDNYRIEMPGTVSPKQTGDIANFVTEVEFFDEKGKSLGKIKGSNKQFKKNVTGFTNDEFFDFSDLSDVKLNIFNRDPNLRYTLFDFNAYTNLELDNFNITDVANVGSATPVISLPQLILEPEQSVSLSLGSMDSNSYALSTISVLLVEDLETGEQIEYEVPQIYAEDVTIPEPTSTLSLLALSTLGASSTLLHKKHKSVNQES